MNLFIDGSCQGNGTPTARAGYAVVETSGIVLSSGRLPGETQTNNRAEMYGLLKALDIIAQRELSGAVIHTDSKLLYDSLTGIAKRKANRDIWEHIEPLAKKLSGKYGIILIPRELNVADTAAKIAANSLI